MNSLDVRYPIGKFEPPVNYSAGELMNNISRISRLPGKLRIAIISLDNFQLDTPYRDGGWTIRQVVHHIPDSHLNGYIRTKWTLTEDEPTIKPYNERTWATTPETAGSPEISLRLLEVLHIKWVVLLETLTPDLFQRQFTHPETKEKISLYRLIANYAWHGEHHLAHITSWKSKSQSQLF